jgi:hypothetical protein
MEERAGERRCVFVQDSPLLTDRDGKRDRGKPVLSFAETVKRAA